MDLLNLLGLDTDVVKSRTYYCKKGKLMFDPHVYEQRYLVTAALLGHDKIKGHIRSIVEYGCNNMKFFVYMKNGTKATKICLVDIDDELLERFKWRVQPLVSEYISKRPQPLKVEVWRGSVSSSNPSFHHIDAVIAIELIEHVYPDVLNEIPYQIFGNLAPKIAIITTPNADYNCLFNMDEGSYRNPDHKYEWSRSEFQDWSHNICERFSYQVQFIGIGKPPDGRENVGHCTQMGVFLRNDFLECLKADDSDDDESESDDMLKPSTSKDSSEEKIPESSEYKLIEKIYYPFHIDKRDHNEKLQDEINYHLNRYRYSNDFYNSELDRFEIPIWMIISACWQTSTDAEEITRTLIDMHIDVEGNKVVLAPVESPENSDYDDENQNPN